MPKLKLRSVLPVKKATRAFYGMAVFIVLLLLPSCNSNVNEGASPAQFKKTLDSATRIFYIKDHNEALHIIDSAVAKNPKISIADQFDVYMMHCDHYVNVVNDYEKGGLYADSMLNLLETTGHAKNYPKQLGIAYFSLGDVAFKKQKFVEAYQYYYKGKLTARNNLNNCTLADYSYRLGMVIYKQEHYDLAANYFKQSFQESAGCEKNFPSFYRQQELLDNAALSYYKAGLVDSAKMFYQKALNFIDTEGKKYPEKSTSAEVARGVVYGNMAQLYIAEKDYKIAVELLKKSYIINLKKGNDNRDAELTELKLAHIYVTQNNIDSLYLLLQNIGKQLDTVKNADAEVDWNHLMANYYQSKNKLKESIGHFNRYATLKDSVDKSKQKLLEIDVSHQFKDFENQSTIAKLKSDNGMQLIYLSVAIVIAAMALIIVLLILSNWRKTRRNVSVLSDLNKKIHEQNESLQRAFLNLELNDKEKDRILRAVAHDLRNPIAGIASLTALMLMEEELHNDQKELLQLIKTTTTNSLELIREILEATGAVTVKDIQKEDIDINTLVSNSIELLRFKAAEKEQKIVFEPLPDPEILSLSREKMWRVISNLISNSIKFSQQGTDIVVKVTHRNADVLISVADSGIGIPDELKHSVFNMFTQAKRPGTIGEPSFGLGLSISKQIIESHGGEIWFESVANKGTTFYILLKESSKKPGAELLHQ
ncbi:tetratricopeptide repeat-containing sensor histidine kinase [Mucilaginibacter sp. HMF5004]|uniref:tetratricopeptide repeat-containing sensor histidine kinase n=1 Tax=Mucilaginibacter rivuli TaxID=2857527 RepID=UPI001C5E1D24|nr:tetratricopeptide repeat-containing sensor histidine kinase [Mucilaginibacter rivuli]MBW4891336.1 tetratricopeptide repeat-containing sensor histidine kinase [Mucilaginibacter rivuli]